MIDYTICYKEQWQPDDYFAAHTFDFFCAALTSDDRAHILFAKANAQRKQWLVLPEYKYTAAELPPGSYTYDTRAGEADYIAGFLDGAGLTPNSKLCIDITGLLAPYLLFLLRALAAKGIVNFEVLYAEPGKYLEREETKFSGEIVREVRQVYGFEGSHIPDTSSDLLVLGAGYDHQLLKMVAMSKEGARVVEIFGMPALRADMYQENILRASRASAALGRAAGDHQDNHLVPAHDPFMSATMLSRISEGSHFTNLYLCPLATKPQVLGFGIYYLHECINKPVSILYPFCELFPQKTSVGIGRVWCYSAQLALNVLTNP